jgi:hypothetical protein
MIKVLLAATLAVLVTTGGTAQAMPPASSFSARVDNPWFPLVPGSRYVYVGVKDGKPSREVLRVTRRTTRIEGIPCVVIDDRLYIRGRLEERTTDWYSQDSAGNVWYLGENTAELYPSGRVKTTAGTWRHGVNGGKAGIFMPAQPRVGLTGREEYLKGQAEDYFKVIGLFGTLTGGDPPTMLLTQEWTPLEPGVLDHKMYVRGIGTVLEQTEKGGNERNELVSYTRG